MSKICIFSLWEQWSQEADGLIHIYDEEQILDRELDQKKENNSDNSRKQRKKKDTGMAKRKDQVMRDLLRKIRREFKRCFYDTTLYFKINKEHSLECLYKCILSFTNEKISEIDSEKTAFALGSMLFPVKIKEMIHKNLFTFIQDSEKHYYLNMIDTIQSPFRRFNFKTFKSFISWGEIATVLIHFPEILIPFKLSEDEAVGFGIIEDEWMLELI